MGYFGLPWQGGFVPWEAFEHYLSSLSVITTAVPGIVLVTGGTAQFTTATQSASPIASLPGISGGDSIPDSDYDPVKDAKPAGAGYAVNSEAYHYTTNDVYEKYLYNAYISQVSGVVGTPPIDPIDVLTGGLPSVLKVATFGAFRIAARAGAQSFKSFSSLKNALGPAGPGKHWHHVVEQTPGNVARFGAQSVHNTQNVMRLDAGVHQQISGFYSSIQPQVTGSASMTVRQWMSTQSFEAQQAFGQQVLRQFGGL